MNVSILLIGAVAGLHSASCGAYKDSPYESFEWSRVIREIFVCVTGAWVLSLAFSVTALPASILFLSVISWGRLVTETYKQFIREEPQTKYKIPSMVHAFKAQITSRWQRGLIGVGFLFLIYLIMQSAVFIGRIAPLHVAGALIGLLIGVFNAVGGSYKDGFFEGFDGIKFFRSPIIATIAGILMTYLTANPLLILFAALGLERMVSECYKGFIKARYVPGKFRRVRAAFPEYLKLRQRYMLPVYIFTWGFYFYLLLMKHF